ncbi:MAG: DUF3108 domain-containing protein [Deltaproteobacteria bacterium]|nr:DUF3108 domain-containing protein [Deltaproteobacteria bacterium]
MTTDEHAGERKASFHTRRRRVQTWLSVFIGGLQVLFAAPVAASDGIALDYEVRYGPLQILAMHSTMRQIADRYQARSEMRTVGMVALLFPWSATSSTDGHASGTTLRPELHRTRGELRGTARSVAIDYGPAGSVSTAVAPPAEDDERDPVPAALQQDTIDPLTAGLAAVASGCRGTLRVFDGRRRYDMALNDRGDGEVPSSRHNLYNGRARLCRVTITPLAGFWRRNTQEDYRPSQLDAWVAAPAAGLRPVPVYLELTAPRGTVGIHLSAARALDQDLATDEHR